MYQVYNEDERTKAGFTITYRFDLYEHKKFINILKVIVIRHPKHIKKYEEWLKAVKFGLNCLQSRVDEIYVTGFSTGGALILYELLKNPVLPIKGLFLFAPACSLSWKFVYLARFTRSMSLALPHSDWLTMVDDFDYAKYTSFTVNSLQQVYLLTKKINFLAKMQRIKTPMFWVVTKNDEVLNINKLINFFNEQPNPLNRMIYYSTKAKHFNDGRIQWHNSGFPEKNIRNFSHISLAVSGNHPYYGEHGTYQDIVIGRMQSLLKRKKILPFYGSIEDLVIFTQKGITRLAWNPDFESLCQQMNKFLNSLQAFQN